MNEITFEFEMQRLNESFKNFYTKNKRQMISNIVSELPEPYFAKCIEKALWADRPPKIEWFHELVSAYRKRNVAASTVEQMRPQENSIFSEQDIEGMKKFYLKMVNNELSQKDYSDFQDTIRAIVSSRPDIKCKTCLDQKWYLPRDTMNLQECLCI